MSFSLKDNKFKILNTKSLSLTKINPYYNNKEHYLPYKYSDPSFRSTYQGPLLQKDFYILNLMNNRLRKKNIPFPLNTQQNFQPPQKSLGCIVSKESVLTFNSQGIGKNKFIEDFKGYALSLLKTKYLEEKEKENFKNNKKKLKMKSFSDKPKMNMKYYLDKFREENNNNNYRNWEKIKEDYAKKNHDESKYVLFNNKKDFKIFKNVVNVNKFLATSNKNRNSIVNSIDKEKNKINLRSYENLSKNQNKEEPIAISVGHSNFFPNKSKNYLPYLTSERDHNKDTI